MKKYLGWIALAVLATAAIFYFLAGHSSPPASAPAASVLVSTIKLTPGTLPAIVTGDGSVQPGPNAQSDIALGAAGIVSGFLAGPGAAVSAGQPLAHITPDPLSVAELRKAESAQTAAHANVAHVAALLSAQLATRADLAAAEQTAHDADATLTALRANGTGIARTLNAATAGIVSAVLVAPGTLQPAGTAIIRFASTNGLVATVGLPARQAATVKPGDTATLTLLGTGATQAATVLTTGAMLDPQTGLLPVSLSLSGDSPLGAPVSAAITTGALQGDIVPRDAVQNDEKGDYVFQIDKNNVAHRETVKIVGTDGQQTVIAPTLDRALPLVTQGAYQLDDGMSVRLQAAGGTTP